MSLNRLLIIRCLLTPAEVHEVSRIPPLSFTPVTEEFGQGATDDSVEHLPARRIITQHTDVIGRWFPAAGSLTAFSILSV